MDGTSAWGSNLLGIKQDLLDLGNARLHHTLLLAGAVVLGVFTQVAVVAGLSNLLGNLAAAALQLLQLCLELLAASISNLVGFFHYLHTPFLQSR